MARTIAVSQITTAGWGFEESVEGYARADGIGAIGVWPDKLFEVGAEKGAELIREAGLGVSSLVFIANFTRDSERGVEEGRRAVEDAQRSTRDCWRPASGGQVGALGFRKRRE